MAYVCISHDLGRLTPTYFIADVNPDDARGMQGNKGMKGMQGMKGEVGPKGDIGPTGDEGFQGQKGDRGTYIVVQWTMTN